MRDGKARTPRAGTPQLRRSSRRVGSTKSPYFEHPSESEDSAERAEDAEDVEDAEDQDFEATGESLSGEEGSGDDDDADDDDFAQNAKPKSASASTKRARAASSSAATADRERKKSKVEFIPNRAPSPGDTEYADDRIHPNTLRFLRELAQNNRREWFHEHDAVYRAAKADFEKLVEVITEAMPTKVDDTIPELPAKDLVFRIHRDIRFSSDLTPYKTHFSACWSRTGKKGPYACYYLHLEPDGKSMVGGGLWHPEADALSAIREDIDQSPHALKSVLTDERFASEFFAEVVTQKLLPKKSAKKQKKTVNYDSADGSDAKEHALIEAFISQTSEDALKKAPKDYPKDHKDIALLRLKSFTIHKRLSDREMLSSDALDCVLERFKSMEPLITYLNSIVRPDS